MMSAQKLQCLVERIISHGGRVYTVVLRPERPAPAFRPGQFLHLALDPYDATGFWPESRVFSIASSPVDRERLEITYSVVGRFTTRMEAELGEGGSVWVKMPYGEFVVKETGDVVLCAGGTGMTAFTAFLDGLAPDGSRTITLAYGARTRDLLIYRNLVERCAERLPGLDVSYFVEEPLVGDAGSSGADRSAGLRRHEDAGRVSLAALWPRIPRPFEASYYISGPPAMLRGLSQDLRTRDISAAAIHIDAWE
jgi:NAD(P)H-flavin reductase